MMIQTLRQLGFSGEFHASVPSQAALREGGQVILLVHGGNVVSCSILNKNGQKLYHSTEAQRLLPKLGILDWKLVPPLAAKTVNADNPANASMAKPAEKDKHFIPHRLVVPMAEIRTWSTLQRSVYFLIDGIRSTEQIAMLLSQPLPTIEQIIHDFQASGTIAPS